MKKSIILLALSIIVLASCEKETTYEKADLIGTWEQVSPAPDLEGCDSGSSQMEFTDDELTFITICDGAESSIGLDYTFDGKVISYSFLININMTIKELTSDKLVVEESIEGFNVTETVTYEKVQ